MGHSEVALSGKEGHHSNSRASEHDPRKTRPRSSAQDPESTMLEAAVQLASFGYYVGQVYGIVNGRCSCGNPACRTPGKHPIGGDSRCTVSADEAARMWKERSQAGVCINLARSGLVDVSSDSADALVSFRKRGLPPTLSFQSGSGVGHEHHLYQLPEGAPQVRWCKSGELDLMSAGIAVFPPSVSGKGPYRLLTELLPVADLPPAPAWVIEELVAHQNREYEAAHIDQNAPPVRLRGVGLDFWNGVRSSTKPDGSIDRSKTLVTIGRYLADAGASAKVIVEALEERDAELGLRCYLDRNDAERRYAEIAADAVNRLDDTTATPAATGLTLLTFADLLSRPLPEWIVQGILQDDSTATVFGEYGSYKSFAMLGLAVSMVLGQPWLGHKVKQGPVIYVAGEGVSGLRPRLEALAKHHQFEPGDLGNLRILDHAIAVSDPLQVNSLLDAIDALDLPEPPVMVVLDTLARTFGPGNENQQSDANLYVAGMDRIRTRLGKATVVAIHHPNKNGTLRGSTVLPGAFDTAIEVTKRTGAVQFRCEKMKDGAEFGPFWARPELVMLSTPREILNFERRESIVLVSTDEPGEERITLTMDGEPTVLSPTNHKLVRALQAEPDHRLSLTSLLAQSGVKKDTFNKNRQSLLDTGLVEQQKVGNSSFYRLVEREVEDA